MFGIDKAVLKRIKSLEDTVDYERDFKNTYLDSYVDEVCKLRYEVKAQAELIELLVDALGVRIVTEGKRTWLEEVPNRTGLVKIDD